MEFLSLEAEKDGFQLPFSDDKTENTTNEIGDFINDDPIEEEDVSFYRERDPLNLDDYPKFNSQIRNPIEAIFLMMKVILVKMNNQKIKMQWFLIS